MAKEKKYILDSDTLAKKLNRLALEVIENNIEEKEIILAGIENNGYIIAEELRARIKKNADISVELLSLQIDKSKPKDIILSKEMDFTNKVIIIIDDVTNTGKALVYALKPFLNYFPKKIQTLVLVERTHTQFPVSANYKGYSIATTLQEHITVEVDGKKLLGAYLS